MPRLYRTALSLSLCVLALPACSTLYRPIYSPGKSNYKKPPEKKENAELLLNTPNDGAPQTMPVPADPGLPGAGAPMLDPMGGAAPGAAAPAIPGLEPAPAIPGLPNP